MPQIGDERWIVEWIYELGDDGPDSHKSHRKALPDEQSAMAFAKQVWHRAVDGLVEFAPQRYEAYDDGDGPYLPHWEYIDHSKIWDGEIVLS